MFLLKIDVVTRMGWWPLIQSLFGVPNPSFSSVAIEARSEKEATALYQILGSEQEDHFHRENDREGNCREVLAVISHEWSA